MTRSPPTVGADCSDCPHAEPVSGACGHDLNQVLVSQFTDNPDSPCPVGPEGE